MANLSLPGACLRLVAACALAVAMAAGRPAALAHGQHGGGNAGWSAPHGGSAEVWNDPGHPQLHGPGSSHNPIVYRPPKVRPPIVKVGPAKPLPSPVQHTLLPCHDHRGFAGTPNVRDHRTPHGHHRCGWPE